MARRRSRTPIPGHFERRGDSYRIRLCVRGKRHSFTVHTTDRTVAEQAASQRAKQLRQEAERKRLGLPQGIRFSELLERFTLIELPMLAKGTQSSYRVSFRPFRAFFVRERGNPTLTRIRSGDVKECHFNVRMGEGAGATHPQRPWCFGTDHRNRTIARRSGSGALPIPR